MGLGKFAVDTVVSTAVLIASHAAIRVSEAEIVKTHFDVTNSHRRCGLVAYVDLLDVMNGIFNCYLP